MKRIAPALTVALLSLAGPLVAQETRPIEQALGEIGQHLRTVTEDRIVVLWVIDSSSSLTDDLESVRARVADVFEAVDGRKSLSMGVLAFDEKPRLVLRPSADLETVRRAIDAVGTEGSGRERPMAAVGAAAGAFGNARAYRLIVLVSDEKGLDEDDVDQAIRAVRRARAHVFAICREAPFGWGLGHERDTALGFQVTIDTGPESPGVETLQKSPLCCHQDWFPWCRKMLTDPARRAKESYFQRVAPLACDLGGGARVGSGFPAWGLARLAAETDGRTFFLDPSDHRPAALEGYAPELTTRAEWERNNRADRRRRAIVHVLGELEEAGDFSLPASGLTAGLGQSASRQATKVEGQVDEWLRLLEAAAGPAATGDGPADRRWQAHRDLLVAQLHVLRHFLEQYRLALTDGDYPAGGDVGLAPRRLPRGDGARRDAAAARLRAVVADHPGTPWARTAELLLEDLGGFDLTRIAYGTGAPQQGNRE